MYKMIIVTNVKWSLKIIQGHVFGASEKQMSQGCWFRMRACNFLLVVNSNICIILLRFRDIAGFLLKQTPLFHAKFEEMFPLD